MSGPNSSCCLGGRLKIEFKRHEKTLSEVGADAIKATILQKTEWERHVEVLAGPALASLVYKPEARVEREASSENIKHRT